VDTISPSTRAWAGRAVRSTPSQKPSLLASTNKWFCFMGKVYKRTKEKREKKTGANSTSVGHLRDKLTWAQLKIFLPALKVFESVYFERIMLTIIVINGLILCLPYQGISDEYLKVTPLLFSLSLSLSSYLSIYMAIWV